ncbi:fumarylacetoacetate hydrolase family protein [Cryptosporangium sp. NPDC048952]|uniref:fumarylacetoacetate hydrolase family protein n=1 Tax=Cryptosporangium sp. NPDC048952 TaxID=3363961 RepID=UPI0037226613
MKLALFDDNRLGVVVPGDAIIDVTGALPWPHDPDPLTAGWWRALCRDFARVRPALERAARDGVGRPLGDVMLRAPVLGPSKILAAASNYREHVTEMHTVQERTLGRVEPWMLEFDVFLKAPSSVVGPGADVVLPPAVVTAGQEIHHESELVIVIGSGGKDIPADAALEHVLGFTAGLDVTVRSPADRSRRKSYDSFSPVGPWIATRDEVGDGSGLDIVLTCDGDVRQSVCTDDLLVPVAGIVAYASSVMTLEPGDLLFTGAPPGVGPVRSGEKLHLEISRIGGMDVGVV